MHASLPLVVESHPCTVLCVGRSRSGVALAQTLDEIHPEVSLGFADDLAAAEEMLPAPDLVLLAGSGPEPAGALAKARAAWGLRVPVVVFLDPADPEDPKTWYRRGANCVIRVPGEGARAGKVRELALRYWLDVVSLPGDW